jgi:large subunit ribosomal protein L21e
MVKKLGSVRTRTRHKFQKSHREKGKISTSRFFNEFKIGDKVALDVEPAYHGGMFFRRYCGLIGEVSGTAGTCYEVRIKDQNKSKTLIIHPVHLKRM